MLGAHHRSVIRRSIWLRALAIALLCLTAAGCATYASKAERTRHYILEDDIAGALDELENDGGDDPDVLNLLQRGLLLHYLSRYEESNAAFQTAEAKIADQYTKSVSGEVFAFLTNDENRPYSGYPHEQVLLHIYGALNYAFMGNLQDALVECRRVGLTLSRLERVREDKKGYTDDGFAEWLSAIFFAGDFDGNSTLVSARRAQAAYSEYGALWNFPTPDDLIVDHIRWANQFGFPDEALELAESYPGLAAEATPLGVDEGELVLVYESGFVNHLEQVVLQFPILETDDRYSEAEMAVILTQRGPRSAWVRPQNVKLKYWLRIATPVMRRSEFMLQNARMIAGDQTVDAYEVEDVSAIAQLTFDEGSGSRLLKTILRALAKYSLTQAAGNKGEVAGLVANIFASASEKADTRSWTTLPDKMHMARMRLPAGVHQVVVEVLDGQGTVRQTAVFDQVLIKAGEATVVRHRSFR